MEQLYPLLTLFSGATIVLLGSFLFASERELKRKREELEEVKRKQSSPAQSSGDGDRPETSSMAKTAHNDERAREASGRSSQSEKDPPEMGRRQSDQAMLVGLQSDNRELEEKVANLKQRLRISESQLDESASRIHEAFDSAGAFQIEVAALKNQIAEKDQALLNLQNHGDELRSENDELRGETQRLIEAVTALQISNERLHALSPQHQEILERNAHLQSRLAAAERHTEELAMKNKQLQEAVDALAGKLEAAEKSMAEFRMHQRAALADHQQLVETNQKLEQEIGTMGRQLDAAQTRLDEAAQRQREAAERNEALQSELSDHRQAALRELEEAERRAQQERENFQVQLNALEERFQRMFLENQQASDHCAGLEAEAAVDRQQAERSPSAVWPQASAAEHTVDAGSGETSDREQQRKLEALIGDLERELAEGKSQFEALEETHERLRAAERICQDLSNDNRRLGEEIAYWQERLGASEETEREVIKLRQEIKSLQAAQSRVSEQNRQMEERLEGDADVVTAPRLEFDQPATAGSAMDSLGQSSSGSSVLDRASRAGAVVSGPAPESRDFEELKPNRMAWKSVFGYRRLGAVLASGFILVIAGAVAAKILITETLTSSDPELPSSEAIMVERNLEPSPKSATKEPSPKAAPKGSPRLRGAFQTVRPAPVFSEPSENSALIAKLERGIKLNVVDSRDGWLEIRSKHGRPPGFIRQEAAVRIGSN
jgi:chromosome segregation ATPase